MKNYITAIFFVFTFLISKDLSAQETKPAQETRYEAFIAPVLKNSSILDQYAAIAGIRGGWVFNETFVLGAAFYSTANKINSNYTSPAYPESKYELNFTCGGLEFEFMYPSESFLHGSVIMFLGGGGVNYKSENENAVNPYGLSLLIWEPQVNLEFNLTGWLHLNTGVSYRFISGFEEYNNLKPKDISGMSGVVSFKFGKY